VSTLTSRFWKLSNSLLSILKKVF